MLSKKTKYGMKALIYIAKQQDDKLVPIATIAESENISRKFLESILLTLKKSGFLGSKKGVNGGYYLLKNPEEISMASVMRVLEGPISMVPCVSLNFYEPCDDCPDERKCEVHALMAQLRDGALKVLENQYLSDFK